MRAIKVQEIRCATQKSCVRQGIEYTRRLYQLAKRFYLSVPRNKRNNWERYVVE